MKCALITDFTPCQRDILPVPYLSLDDSKIEISYGRQLFVDDYLIERNTCRRIWHEAIPYKYNPVLVPETNIELDSGECPVAAPFNDGVWYDPRDKYYKLYYHAGWFHGTALAISQDGIHWERPDLGRVGHSNLLIPLRPTYERDGALVWLDQHADSVEERWKMFLFNRYQDGEGGELYVSQDGIAWTCKGETGPCGDNSSFFYDPFRRKWVFSIRNNFPVAGRSRAYLARDNFIAPAWNNQVAASGPMNINTPIPWARVDDLDPFEEATQFNPQLYDLNAVAYESLMLGVFAIFNGPENSDCEILGCPKRVDLHFGFSRDGYHWSRPRERKPFLSCSRKKGTWDRGYLHAAGGLCLVFKDKLRFYYGAWSGESKLQPGEKGASSRGAYSMYAGASTGFAEMRRDGFASLGTDLEGMVVTKYLETAKRYLFVNAAADALRVELLDRDNRVISEYSIAESVAFSGDSTIQLMTWKCHRELPAIEGFKIRFTISNGELYSFWLTDNSEGKSNGYLAAGSEHYSSDIDV